MRTVRPLSARLLVPLAVLTLLGGGLLSGGLASAQTAPTQPAAPQTAASQTAPGAIPAASPTSAYLARGRQLTGWFYAQQIDRVWAAFLAPARAEWGNDVAAFKRYRQGGVQTYGAETRVLKEEVMQDGGVNYYLRTATFERGPRVAWTVVFGMDATGRVLEFAITGGSEAPQEQTARAR